MGTVYETITLKNLRDVLNAQCGYKEEDEIHQTQVKVIVDTGTSTLCITEELRLQLGLDIMGERPVTVANGAVEMAKMANWVEIHWKDRSTACQPMVVPGCQEILLGCIPLESMDLIVDPVRLELAGAHGDKIVYRA